MIKTIPFVGIISIFDSVTSYAYIGPGMGGGLLLLFSGSLPHLYWEYQQFYIIQSNAH